MRVGRTGSCDLLIIRSRPGFYGSLRLGRRGRLRISFGGPYKTQVQITGAWRRPKVDCYTTIGVCTTSENYQLVWPPAPPSEDEP